MTIEETVHMERELKRLVDAYAISTDEKNISGQMQLFTPDVHFKVYFGDQVMSEVNGIQQLEKEFRGHVAPVKRYFTTNAQHTFQIDGDRATGIVFSQIKMVRDESGQEVLTDYSVQYHDVYIKVDSKWLIQTRISKYIIIESRPLQS